MATAVKERPNRSRLAFVGPGDGPLYVEVLPELSPRAARAIAAVLVGLVLIGIVFLWLIAAPTPIVSFIFTMLILAGGKSKEVLETQLPLDSLISIVQYDDDCVQIRLPAVEYVARRIAAGLLLVASLVWICSWLMQVWTTRDDHLASLDAGLGGFFPVLIGLPVLLACLYGVIGHRLLTITRDRISYSWRLGVMSSWFSASHASTLTRKLGTYDPYKELRALRSVQRGLSEPETPASSSRLPQHLESLALRIGQQPRTCHELAGLLTTIHREWPKAKSLQDGC